MSKSCPVVVHRGGVTGERCGNGRLGWSVLCANHWLLVPAALKSRLLEAKRSKDEAAIAAVTQEIVDYMDSFVERGRRSV